MGISSAEFWRMTLRLYFLRFQQWQAQERVLDARAALAPWAVFNVHRKAGSEPIRLSTCIPWWDEGEAEQTPEDHARILADIASRHGIRVKWGDDEAASGSDG